MLSAWCRWLSPSMFMAQEPQTPSRQARRFGYLRKGAPFRSTKLQERPWTRPSAPA